MVRDIVRFEVSSLNHLEKQWSTVEPFQHTTLDDDPRLVDKETDIQLELFGYVGDRSRRLFRSSYAYRQETFVKCPSIVAMPTPSVEKYSGIGVIPNMLHIKTNGILCEKKLDPRFRCRWTI